MLKVLLETKPNRLEVMKTGIFFRQNAKADELSVVKNGFELILESLFYMFLLF